ncbi:AMP-binding protein [Sporosarcina koreensis]|uniref:AMP-binding protein n=1 Tax=Sporosarcina koreensis TaxID=334735 RepID=UPI000693BE9A|nr:AMP-binding protein [Sporosarcina koreensis]
MPIGKLVRLLQEMGVLNVSGATGLSSAVARHGVNLMVLLEFAARLHGDTPALIDEEGTVSYSELHRRSEGTAMRLQEEFGIGCGQKVAFLCRNRTSLVTALFAASRLGADVYLLNPDMGHTQLALLLERHRFDLLIHDQDSERLADLLPNPKPAAVPIMVCMPASDRFPARRPWKRMAAGRLVLLTGGTTGLPKAVPHQPSLFNYIDPYLSLLKTMELARRSNVLIATPLCHGYGLAILLSFAALGKTIVLSCESGTEQLSALIRTHSVEVVTVVPVIAERLLAHEKDNLRSLKCIASGGAPLHPKLAQDINAALGPVLFNLYGTSETGLACMATPQELAIAPGAVGRKVAGGRLKLVDPSGNEVRTGETGQICMSSSWSMAGRKSKWIETGDMGYLDGHGLLHVYGRVDDMIVSGGENVHPSELETLLRTHPLIRDTAVVGVPDAEFGQRLCAVIDPLSDTLTTAAVTAWLTDRAARYQMPKTIIFRQIPCTSLGKPDKKRLRQEVELVLSQCI